ncbi:molecular chaperone [Bradyrhizobium sp. LHD-71]|uniref:fimbrial biogenesis chaperone n=1 Tax=Bradyrhizobium sp. LHD-71 TaxID=3072141 RepID=UPI00280FDD66|nr:molecular chaperone [Bradyrhizobium sp. LHD-71]MDQ8729441.1 molecular chaperone [Bradyrhizobium sp. LHD-71]
MVWIKPSALALIVVSYAVPGEAASLRVAPTTLELLAPDSAATLTLRNDGDQPINVQIRVFRWTQNGGVDRLEPTTDVVASPPARSLAPNADYVIRVVRVNKQPVTAEEAYRVVADELPDPSRRRAGLVNLVLRHSVPVFFRKPDAKQPLVSWSVRRKGDTLDVTAQNAGQQRLRIADLRLKDSGQDVALREGLVGYVLGNATVQWSFPARGASLSGRTVTLSAKTDGGQIDATAAVQSGQ